MLINLNKNITILYFGCKRLPYFLHLYTVGAYIFKSLVELYCRNILRCLVKSGSKRNLLYKSSLIISPGI